MRLVDSKEGWCSWSLHPQTDDDDDQSETTTVTGPTGGLGGPGGARGPPLGGQRRVLTLHVLRHDPVVEQAVVLHGALHRLHQEVVGGGAGGVRLALGLGAVGQAGQQEQQVVHVAQELLALARELEGGLVLQDAGGQAQQPRQPVVLDGPVLLVQDLTAGGGVKSWEVSGGRDPGEGGQRGRGV